MLVSRGRADEARRVLDQALRLRPSGAKVVQKRRELDRLEGLAPPPPPPPPGNKSGVVRATGSTGLRNWPTAPPPQPPQRPSQPVFPPIQGRDASATPVAAPNAAPAEPPRSIGLKLWSSPPGTAETRVPTQAPSSERETIPPELPEISVEPIEGLVVAGKYRLDRMLKQGGMGSVWVATHLDLDRPVAIKFMTRSALERTALAQKASDTAGTPSSAHDPVELTRARFEREARAAARIRSVNVVQVFDHGVDRGMPYIVMELLEGEDLGTRLDRQGRFSLPEMAALLAPIAHALGRAHDAGVVHRDLKPENIFVARDGDVEVLKILDFGVSKTIQGGNQQVGTGTLEGSLIGTPFYMSPEQAVGRPDVDHRSDLWSLGVILFRALTGQRPFASTVLLQSVVEIASAPIPKPSSLRPDLGPEVDAFFGRALARQPAERFQSAKEMARAFAQLSAAAEPRVSLSGFAGGVPSMPDVPFPLVQPPAVPVEVDLDSSSDTDFAPRRRWTLPVAGALVVSVVAVGAWMLLRETSPPVTAGEPEPAPSSVAAAAATPTSVATAAPSSDAPVDAATATSSQTTPAGPRTSAPASGGTKKKPAKRDVGY